MKVQTSTWFEVKIACDKVQDDGMTKKVKETFVVDAMTFTEAEAKIIDQISGFFSGDFAVVVEKIAPYREVVFTENPNDNKWYYVKVNLIAFNEKSGKEKKNVIHHLVQSDTFENARKCVDEMYSGTMADFEIAKISETNIIDVFTNEA